MASKKMSHVPCVVDRCGKTPTDKCHVRSKGSGGGNGADNRLMMCRTHHIQQHQYGWDKFISLYPAVGVLLDDMGFEVREVFGVRKLVRR